MSGVQQVTVGDDEADQRLDRWLRRRFPQLPQGRIERLCRRGEIRLDGGRAQPATRLAAGQVVRLPPIPRMPVPPPTGRGAMSETDAEMIRAAVIYRDADVLALNKPPGLAVQGGSGQVRHVDGLAEALRFERDEKPRLVHRLDRDTSGVLLLARSGRAAAGLARAFQGRDARKILLGGGRRSAVAGGRNHPLRAGQGAGPRRRRRRREDAGRRRPTPSPPPRVPGGPPPTTSPSTPPPAAPPGWR